MKQPVYIPLDCFGTEEIEETGNEPGLLNDGL